MNDAIDPCWTRLILHPWQRYWMRKRKWARDDEPEMWGLNRSGAWSYSGESGTLPNLPSAPCRRFRLFADEIAREVVATGAEPTPPSRVDMAAVEHDNCTTSTRLVAPNY